MNILMFPVKYFSILIIKVYEYWAKIAQDNHQKRLQYDELVSKYSVEYPELYKELERRFKKELPSNLKELLPKFTEKDAPVATRKLSQMVLNAICDSLPELIGGSADLTGSNLTRWNSAIDFQHVLNLINYLAKFEIGRLFWTLYSFWSERTWNGCYLQWYPSIRVIDSIWSYLF